MHWTQWVSNVSIFNSLFCMNAFCSQHIYSICFIFDYCLFIETKEMRWLLGNITEKTTDLKSKSVQLETDLSEVNKNLTAICSGNTCGINYQNDLKTDANFSTLPDVTKELDNVANVLDNNDLESKAKEVRCLKWVEVKF